MILTVNKCVRFQATVKTFYIIENLTFTRMCQPLYELC